MGIEDFNVASRDYADRVLIVANSEAAGREISSVLKKRLYACTLVSNFAEAKNVLHSELYDLIVISLDKSASEIAADISSLKADPSLKAIPLLLSHPDADALSSLSGESLKVISAPFQPADLLVKASLLLRVRKTSTTEDSEQAGVRNAVYNLKLRDLTNRFRQDLEEARSIQQSLLPKALPRDPDTAFAAAYIPLEAVGGDLYDLWKIKEGLFGIFIGDVSGHGLSAALIGAMSRMVLSYSGAEAPHEMLMAINRAIHKHMPEGRFLTAAVCTYESKTGKFSVARGGHPAPLLWRASSGEVHEVGRSGLPVGMLDEARYDACDIVIDPGDRLLLVTDGVTEAKNEEGEMIGSPGVSKWLAMSAGERSLSRCLRKVLELKGEFCGEEPPNDDVTLIGIERV